MATDQFLYLLEQLHKASQMRPIPWQPTAYLREFKIGLGEGSVRLRLFDDGFYASRKVTASLLNEDDRTIDELEAHEFESDNFKWLLELYLQAHATAFNLNRMVDSMMGDLEMGKFRELPPEKLVEEDDDDGIPF
jgi:hypothetical protein